MPNCVKMGRCSNFRQIINSYTSSIESQFAIFFNSVAPGSPSRTLYLHVLSGINRPLRSNKSQPCFGPPFSGCKQKLTGCNNSSPSSETHSPWESKVFWIIYSNYSLLPPFCKSTTPQFEEFPPSFSQIGMI